MKRLFDFVFSACILMLFSPIFLIAAVGIYVSSPGQIFYRATRVGENQKPFQMLKFRSMHQHLAGAVITSEHDLRIFRFGQFLRKTKIDELPQFWNVLCGQMSLVGPRPEDPKIVTESYTDWMLETLNIQPGITGPGSVFYYGLGDRFINDADPEGSYVANVLPAKLALERAYMDRSMFLPDLETIWRTFRAILHVVLKRPAVQPHPIDMAGARAYAPQVDWNIYS